MSNFEKSFAENKLRISLSSYANHIIERDCMSFSLKRTTLINAVILNYYAKAECSISLRQKEYKKELESYTEEFQTKNKDTYENNKDKFNKLINAIVNKKTDSLIGKYNKSHPSDYSFVVSLNKAVINLLTQDKTSDEEHYYVESKEHFEYRKTLHKDAKIIYYPGRYVRALLEEYANKPYYVREQIAFHNLFKTIDEAISEETVINVTTANGNRLSIKPYKIVTDPLSMYNYLVGYYYKTNNTNYIPIVNLRICRLKEIQKVEFPSEDIHRLYKLTKDEKKKIKEQLEESGVQFIQSSPVTTKVWLSDSGIKKYNTQLHLRPIGVIDKNNHHIYTFECTENQIIYYFVKFGKDAKILSPQSLADEFKKIYEEALNNYLTNNTEPNIQ
ncbi:MAG: WYL domain-containing protein [Clostridium sp.]|nr:WYL domain-containing protein [Clostridium sp.]MCM1172870.1 WYL domain-containing protein [Clostridium sp.]